MTLRTSLTSLLTLALFSMRRRARRAWMSGLALAIFVAAFGSILFLEAAIDAHTRAVLNVAPDLVVQRLVAGRPALVPLRQRAELAAIAGVRAVTPRVWGYLYMPPISANVTVIGLDDARALIPAIAEGRVPVQSDPAQVLLGHAVAQSLGVRVGERIAIVVQGTPSVLQVAGTLSERANTVSADAFVVTQPVARVLLGLERGEATDFAITLTTPDEQSVVAGKALEISHDFRVISRPDAQRAALLTTSARASFLSLCLFPAFVALLILLGERLASFDPIEQREIGTLKAIGFTTRALLVSKLIESLILALTATTVGVLIAYLHVHVFGAPAIAATLLGWSHSLALRDLPPAFGIADLFALVGVIVVPYVGMSLLSAWRIAFVDPDTALRGAP